MAKSWLKASAEWFRLSRSAVVRRLGEYRFRPVHGCSSATYPRFVLNFGPLHEFLNFDLILVSGRDVITNG